MNYERKEVALEDLELKVEGDTAGTFSGYASTFGKVDLQNEIVEAGAFARSLTKSGGQYPLLWQHNHDEPIGSITAQENSRGLFVRGKLALGVSKAKDAYELLKEKLLTGLSIGFRVIKDGWRDRVRHLKEIDLWEVSLVTFPANTSARVGSIKRDSAPAVWDWDFDSRERVDVKEIFSWIDDPLPSLVPVASSPPAADDEEEVLDDSDVAEESKDLAGRALEWCCADLEIPIPEIVWCKKIDAQGSLGLVKKADPGKIFILVGQGANALVDVIAHECFHLFQFSLDRSAFSAGLEDRAQAYGQDAVERFRGHEKKQFLARYCEEVAGATAR